MVKNRDIGKRLSFIRTKMLNKNAGEFAELMNISRYRLKRYEDGLTPVPGELIAEIAARYHLPAAWILCIDESERNS